MECRGNDVTLSKCSTEGCLKAAMPSGEHCVRCARSELGLSKARKGSNTASTDEGESFLRAPGGASQLLSEDGWPESRRTAIATTMTPPTARRRTDPVPGTSARTLHDMLASTKRGGALSTSSAAPELGAIPSTEPSSVPGTALTERSASQKSAPTEIECSPAGSSIGPLISAEEEKLASLSLVDECLERLNLQMRRLTLRSDGGREVDPIGASHSERQRVGLALKTASEIAKMVRLKLDAVKVFRKLED
jgi:hypothetical protein